MFPFTRGPKFGYILLSHYHMETMENHCSLLLTGEPRIIPGFLRWCEMEFVQPHAATRVSITQADLKVREDFLGASTSTSTSMLAGKRVIASKPSQFGWTQRECAKKQPREDGKEGDYLIGPSHTLPSRMHRSYRQ